MINKKEWFTLKFGKNSIAICGMEYLKSFIADNNIKDFKVLDVDNKEIKI